MGSSVAKKWTCFALSSLAFAACAPSSANQSARAAPPAAPAIPFSPGPIARSAPTADGRPASPETSSPAPGGQGLSWDDLASIGENGEGQGEGVSIEPDSSPRPTIPTIRFGQAKVQGEFSPDVIYRVVRQDYGHLRRCYDSALRRNPNVGGQMVMKFNIDQQGKARNVTYVASEPLTMLVPCATKVATPLAFPAPEKGKVAVEIPITFKPGTE